MTRRDWLFVIALIINAIFVSLLIVNIHLNAIDVRLDALESRAAWFLPEAKKR